ncbi:hypothetical protein LCGC14_0456780 [marine sediment metagenome]|uniref:Uncharacterized protein n=1 Tax=marine sediment metagenome TaxID=412755 RepID=A0A0F9V313_9ZZZZ|nr:hypothetical protein [Candidatus Aminicenantes bacterium]
MENIVWKIRTWIYVVAIAVFCTVTICRSANAFWPPPQVADHIDRPEVFWPPDMVPHPMPPDNKDDRPEIDPNDYCSGD